jgi:hypothetical protein
MWEAKNETAFGVERNWVRDKYGRHKWVVAVKATFSVADDGRIRLADEQVPPAMAPEYTGEPSMRWDSDVLYEKTGTDIVAEAFAHAPAVHRRASGLRPHRPVVDAAAGARWNLR